MSLSITIRYPSAVTLFRVPHDVERVRMYADEGENIDFGYTGNSNGTVRRSVIVKGDALPEVYRTDPDHQTPLDKEHQFFWRYINPMLSDEKFSTLYGNTLAWCNGTGAGVRHNWITGANADKQDIAFDAARLCGGAIVPGTRIGNVVHLKSLLLTDRIPDPLECIKHPEWGFWYWGTSVNPSGEVNLITRLGVDGRRYPVRVANITARPITLPARELHQLPTMNMPEATWVAGG